MNFTSRNVSMVIGEFLLCVCVCVCVCDCVTELDRDLCEVVSQRFLPGHVPQAGRGSVGWA